MWKERLRKTSFIRGDDGRIVFYPHGPFKGYVLPRKEFEPIIVDSLARIVAMNIAILIAAVFVGAFVGTVSAMLTAVGFLEFLYFRARIRRLTKKLRLMPRELSVRLYALKQNPDELSQQFWSQLMMFAVTLPIIALALFLQGVPVDMLLSFVVTLLFVTRLFAGTAYVWHVRRRMTAGTSA
jgi:hypothetical protein